MTLRRLFILCCLFLCLQHSLVSSSLVSLRNNVENYESKRAETSNLGLRARHHSLSIQDGLSFTRNIKHVNNASFVLNLEGNHCKSHDKFGDNTCHYDWGEKVLGNYTLEMDTSIQDGDYMTGSFHIDYVVPYEFTCLLCGEPCVFEIPVLDVTRTLEMPPCPIGPTFSSRVREKLMNFSPTAGIKTHLQGTVKVFQQSGHEIAEFSVSAYVK